ncbi:MAG: tyrosine-type recombinase/integrase [Flavobacteriaceae bacterium]|nr:tyrosine-type recombinase/integrase [Flavobacteriaceae bacterium]
MLINSFLKYLSYEKKSSPHTVAAYLVDLRAFENFCKDNLEIANIKDVDYVHIRSWIVSLSEKNNSHRSINRKMSTLKSFYKYLLKIHEVDKNPLTQHQSLKIGKKVIVPFSEKEIITVLNSISGNDFKSIRNKLVVELLYSTGMRRAELVKLEETNVDISNKTIKIFGKRNKERIVPILDSIIESIEDYQAEREKITTDSTRFFITEKGNKIYETLVYRIINDYFSKVSSKTKNSPHVIRHSFATHLLNQGADLNSVKELLGHASLASTQVYTHNSLEKIKEVYNQTHPRSHKSD